MKKYYNVLPIIGKVLLLRHKYAKDLNYKTYYYLQSQKKPYQSGRAIKWIVERS